MSEDNQQNDVDEVKPNITQSRLASLVGFEEEITQEQKEITSVSPDSSQEQKEITSVSPDSISNNELQPTSVSDPRDVSSFRPIWVRPGNKAYVVFAGTSVLALLFYLISSTLFNTPLRQAQKPSQNLQEFPVPEETQNPIGAFKVETALGDQAAAIARLNTKKQLSKPSKVVPSQPNSRKIAATPRSTPNRPVVTSVANPPRRFVREPSRYSRDNYPPVRQYRKPISPSPAAIAQQPSTHVKPQVPAPATDPTEKWLAAAQIGSYSTSSNKEQAPQVTEEEQIAGNENLARDSQVEYASFNSKEPEEKQRTDNYQAQEDPILQERPRQFINAGTTAKATLATSLAWDESEKSLAQDGVVIVLDEPLLAADGAVILTAGSQLIAKVQSLYDSGLVRLVAVTAIAQQDGERVEIDIPEAAILVHGVEGKPLIAKQLKSRPGRFGADLGQVLLGAARNGASILNRPRQSSSFSNGGYSSSSQSNEPNFLAGAFEGASETLLDNLERRNQLSTERSGRSSVWVLKAKTKVEVFVTESVALDLPDVEEPHVALPRSLGQQERVAPPRLEPEFSDRIDAFKLDSEPARSSSATQYYFKPGLDSILPDSY